MGTMRQAVEKAMLGSGGGAALARKLTEAGHKRERQAVYQWQKVPAELVLIVEQLSGVPRSELRPDLYPADREMERTA